MHYIEVSSLAFRRGSDVIKVLLSRFLFYCQALRRSMRQATQRRVSSLLGPVRCTLEPEAQNPVRKAELD